MARCISWLVTALLFGLLPTGVRAHLDMTSPVSRYGPDILKTGPCGAEGGTRSGNINYFEPGETIDVEWDEYIDHPSHYRIAFDEDGDDDFVDPAFIDPSEMLEFYSNDAVLLDEIEDESPSDPYYRVSVTLPDVECDNCTLQVIQVMYDKVNDNVDSNDIYYQCADLVLRKGGAPPGPDAGADAGPDAGAGLGAGASSECSASRGDVAWFGLGLWLLSLVAIRRLARRRGLPV
ncbi:MAG: lytic polysaccharide monooxygenase [Deltaproteobacteria bacterium]|nr:lytic polysaccharide monooxygenase [Deltaproteobacteria bacterium]